MHKAILPRRWGNALRHKTIEKTKSPTTIHTLIFRIVYLSATSLPYHDMSHFAQTHPVKNNTPCPFSLVLASKAASPKCRRYLATNLSNLQFQRETTRNWSIKWYVRPSQHLHHFYCLPSQHGNYMTALTAAVVFCWRNSSWSAESLPNCTGSGSVSLMDVLFASDCQKRAGVISC